MKIEIRLRIDVGDDGPGDEEILVLDKPHDQLEKVGLSLAEAKELLARVQERVVGAQAAAFVADHRHCNACGRRLWSKGRTSFQFRTPFGDVPVTGPRLKSCRCQSATRGSFSPLTGLFTEHVAPEMLYLEDEVGLARAVRRHGGVAQGRPSRGDYAQCADGVQPPAACRHEHGGIAWRGANLLGRGLPAGPRPVAIARGAGRGRNRRRLCPRP